MTHTNKYVAEALGTFGLVFAGTGAIIVNATTDGAVTHVGISLTFGLVVMAMIYSFGDVSGAHINPAVTVAFWAARRLPGRTVAPYVASQLAGAFAASGVLCFLFPGSPTLGETLPSGAVVQSLVLETILTFLLMLVILCVSTGAQEKGVMGGAAIGAVITFEACFGGPISGASMNPARSLAPAVVGGQLEHLWIYVAGPVVGALTAVFACRFVHVEGCCSPVEAET
jgi:aquaporin Z